MNKDKIRQACQEIQVLLFKGKTSGEVYDILTAKGYTSSELDKAMDVIESMATSDHSPVKKAMDDISEQMEKMTKGIDGIKTSKEFYSIIEHGYLNYFMPHDRLRGMPICFLFNQASNPHVGIVPMSGSNDHSPMDDLKEVVYSTNPDAYLFCGEASMKKIMKGDPEYDNPPDHKYGDIINDPKSEDIVVLTGNTRSGDDRFHKSFRIKGTKDKMSFEKMEEDAKDMQSEKIP